MRVDQVLVTTRSWSVVAALVGSAVLVVPATVEAFQLPKATFVVLTAVLSTALTVALAVWHRRIAWPVSVPALAAAAFAVAAAIATLTSPSPILSVVGFYGRYSGLALYLSAVVLFLAVLAMRLSTVRLLSRALIVAAAAVVGYGLLQAVGLEPLAFGDNGLGRTFSTMGNVNFSAAWSAAATAVLLAAAADRRETRGCRVVALVVLPLAVLYATVVTTTSQGVAVVAVSAGWAALVLLVRAPARPTSWRQRRGAVPVVVGVVAAVAAAALVAVRGRVAAALDQSFVERPDFWRAALDIWADNVVLGTGLDTYAHHFMAYRPASHAVANGLASADAPHSVPLAMLSNGGLVLGLPYLVFVVSVAAVLVRGLVRADPSQLPVLAGWGGVWLGYQAQSLVSIDVPPLVVLHWVSAGVLVVTLAPPRWRVLVLPGRAVSQKVNRRGIPVRAAEVPRSTYATWGALSVLGLAVAWLTLTPLRADLTAASAAPLTTQGRYDAAALRFEAAAKRNPAEAEYAYLAARAYEALGQPARAFRRAVEAAERDPGSPLYALYAARQAKLAGRAEDALAWYERAIVRDPRDPLVLNEVAAHLASAGAPKRAAALFTRVLEVDPSNEQAAEGLASL